jgi:hypothetical protein
MNYLFCGRKNARKSGKARSSSVWETMETIAETSIH